MNFHPWTKMQKVRGLFFFLRISEIFLKQSLKNNFTQQVHTAVSMLDLRFKSTKIIGAK